MQHPFTELRDENLHRYTKMKVLRPLEVHHAAESILNNRAKYQPVMNATGVPIAELGALTMRESNQDFHSYFGNGDPLTRMGRPAKTVHVPSNRGPFGSWEEGAIDALHLDALDRVADWDIARCLYEGEAFNGFGPRAHGRVSGYVFAGSDQYDGGKYVADGKWDPNFTDPQLGVAVLIWGMLQIEPGLLPEAKAPKIAPKLLPGLVPIGVGGGEVTAFWIQATLNTLGADPQLRVDNSYGRVTTRAVRDYQSKNLDITGQPLEVDGFAGPKTIASMQAKLTWKATQ